MRLACTIIIINGTATVSSYNDNIIIFITTCRVYIGKKPHIMIADLDILKQIMVKEFDKFPDHSVSS